MNKPQKFLFNTDFATPRVNVVDIVAVEDEDTVDNEPAPPPPPTFSEEELALARDQAFEAGRQTGLQEAAASLEQMIGMALATAAHHLQALEQAQQAANSARGTEAVAVALAVVRKLHPEFCRRFGLVEIETAIKDSLAHLGAVPRITVKTHPDLVDGVRAKSDALAAQSGFEGKLVVTGDPLLALGDCRLDWGDGGVERDAARSWAEIDRAVEASLGSLSSVIAAVESVNSAMSAP